MTRILVTALTCLATSILSTAAGGNAYPLPEERGTAGILQALERLPVSARVLWVQAHPDDESGATVTWLARHAHVRTAIFSFTRGEGGQNILGEEKYEALAVLRTGEFLEACRIYGAELHFGGMPDFGFSKSAEETFRKWNHEKALDTLVAFIRRWKPDVIVSAFRGDSSAGHGHHQASGILAREAFRAAAEGGGNRWAARRFFERSSGPAASVRIPVGDHDPVLGRSYREIGSEGYAKHRTQSMGATYSPPGPSFDTYRLVEPQENSPEGIVDFLTGLPVKLSDLRPQKTSVADTANASGLAELQRDAEEAVRLFTPRRPAGSLAPIVRGLRRARDLLTASRDYSEVLTQKAQEFEDAANAVLGIYLAAGSGVAAAAPGESVSVSVRFFNRGSETVHLESVTLLVPTGWRVTGGPKGESLTVGPGRTADAEFVLEVPQDAKPSDPYAFPSGRTDQGIPVTASARYRVLDTTVGIGAPVRARAGDPVRGVDFVDFQVVPALSVSLTPEVMILPLRSRNSPRELKVSLANHHPAGSRGSLRVDAPEGWTVAPSRVDFALGAKGETSTFRFRLRAADNAQAGTYAAEAVAVVDGREYRDGCQVISYPEIWTRYLHRAARSTIRVMDLEVAPNLSVGYVPGTGDQVPAFLSQMGLRVDTLSAEELAFGDLSRYGVIVTGIRAYNVNAALRAHNRRILEFAADGGTVIVQYNTPGGASPGRDAPQFAFAPFPMSGYASDRITVEDSPVSILAPEHPAMRSPNRIGQADFDGWIQERGLYFMRNWDPNYTAILAGGDPGEEPLKGGLLVARVGKGWYVLTAYAWFRQLPAGVPGAYRIFANLLSLGR